MGKNLLVESLPRADRARLLAAGEPCVLALSQIICEQGDDSRFVWFPLDCFISLVTLVAGHAGLEVGMVGSEGLVGTELALGVSTVPLRIVVQGAGLALRLSATDFQIELARSAALKATIDRYLYVTMAQRATSAACLRFHQIAPRLARWLLMSQDRAHSPTFFMTQEFLAYMLGVRRVGITAAAGELQRSGFIKYSRGQVHVTDRAGLEGAACTCYASDLHAYATQFHGPARKVPDIDPLEV